MKEIELKELDPAGIFLTLNYSPEFSIRSFSLPICVFNLIHHDRIIDFSIINFGDLQILPAWNINSYKLIILKDFYRSSRLCIL